MTRAQRFAIETPRGHYLPVVGERRRDCALSIACGMAHEVDHPKGTPASCPPRCGWSVPMEPLDASEYVYAGGAGALAQIASGGRRHDRGDGERVGQPPQPVRKAVRNARRAT